MNYIRNIKFFVGNIYKDHPKELLLVIIILIFEAILTSTSVLSIIPFADYLIDPSLKNPSKLTQYFLFIFDFFNLNANYFIFASIFVISNLLRALVSLIIKYKVLKLKFEIEKSISKNILKDIFQARWTFFNNLEYGGVFNSLTKEMSFIGSALRQIGEVFGSFFSLVTYLAIPFFLDLKLSLLLFFSCLLIGSPFLILSKTSKHYGKMRTLAGNKYFGKLSETFQSAKLILGFGRSKEEVKKNFSLLDNYVKSDLKSQFVNLIAMYLFKPLAIIALIAAFGINFDLQSIPTYSAFFWSFYGALPLVAQIFNSAVVINNFTPSYMQIQNIADRSKSHFEHHGDIELDNYNFNISLEKVTFKYKGKNEIIEDISVSFLNNKINTIIGESGVGKSTLIDLILGFQLPASGKIFYGKENLNNLNLKKLRGDIGIVPQDPFLFNTSIRENIKWAKLDCEENEIYNTLKLANAYDFVMSLPDKLDTNVGIRGLEISGGQRQRIALARALIRNPSILILDEATSSIDKYSAELIMDAIKNISKNTTIIISTHDDKVLKISDKIILLKDKKIFNVENFNKIQTEKTSIKDILQTEKNL